MSRYLKLSALFAKNEWRRIHERLGSAGGSRRKTAKEKRSTFTARPAPTRAGCVFAVANIVVLLYIQKTLVAAREAKQQ